MVNIFLNKLLGFQCDIVTEENIKEIQSHIPHIGEYISERIEKLMKSVILMDNLVEATLPVENDTECKMYLSSDAIKAEIKEMSEEIEMLNRCLMILDDS